MLCRFLHRFPPVRYLTPPTGPYTRRVFHAKEQVHENNLPAGRAQGESFTLGALSASFFCPWRTALSVHLMQVPSA